MQPARRRATPTGQAPASTCDAAQGRSVARAAVNTEVTVPAIVDMIAELERMRDTARYGMSSPGLATFWSAFSRFGSRHRVRWSRPWPGWPSTICRLTSLMEYRARVEAVDIAAVEAAARAHLLVDDADIVLVGDVDAFGGDLEAAGLGRLVIDRDDTGPGPWQPRPRSPRRLDRLTRARSRDRRPVPRIRPCPGRMILPQRR